MVIVPEFAADQVVRGFDALLMETITTLHRAEKPGWSVAEVRDFAIRIKPLLERTYPRLRELISAAIAENVNDILEDQRRLRANERQSVAVKPVDTRSGKVRSRAERTAKPSKETLEALAQTERWNFRAMARSLGCSEASIRNWCKEYELQRPWDDAASIQAAKDRAKAASDIAKHKRDATKTVGNPGVEATNVNPPTTSEPVSEEAEEGNSTTGIRQGE